MADFAKDYVSDSDVSGRDEGLLSELEPNVTELFCARCGCYVATLYPYKGVDVSGLDLNIHCEPCATGEGCDCGNTAGEGSPRG